MTKEVYYAYKRPLWAEHKRKVREKRCRNTKGNQCINNCGKCEKQQIGSVLSMNRLLEQGVEIANNVSVVEQVEERLITDALYKALETLDPIDRQIVDLYCNEKSEREIAAITKMSQKGINKWKKQIFSYLREQLKIFL